MAFTVMGDVDAERVSRLAQERPAAGLLAAVLRVPAVKAEPAARSGTERAGRSRLSQPVVLPSALRPRRPQDPDPAGR
ncbi:MAG: hypothetical protein ACLU3I_01155 [Acutalibacteraceae bacterium]